jgi:hypothetical protein
MILEKQLIKIKVNSGDLESPLMILEIFLKKLKISLAVTPIPLSLMIRENKIK